MVERGGVNDGGTENDRTPRPEVPEEVENERVRRFLSDLHRPRDALAVLRFVLRHPDGVPIPVVTEETLGETPTGRNDRFIRRLIERNPRFFETDRSQAVYVVAPSPDALNLITGRQISKPPDSSEFASLSCESNRWGKTENRKTARLCVNPSNRIGLSI